MIIIYVYSLGDKIVKCTQQTKLRSRYNLKYKKYGLTLDDDFFVSHFLCLKAINGGISVMIIIVGQFNTHIIEDGNSSFSI